MISLHFSVAGSLSAAILPCPPLSPESLCGMKGCKDSNGSEISPNFFICSLVFCISRTSHVVMCLFKSLFHPLPLMKFGSHHTKFQCQKSSELKHSPSSNRAKHSCILNREKLERNKVLALFKWQDIK